MKNLLNNLTLLVLTFFCISSHAGALNNAGALSTSNSPTSSNSNIGVNINNTNDVIQPIQTDAQKKQLEQQAVAKNTQSITNGTASLSVSEKYFGTPPQYTTCDSIQHLYCPPLKSEWTNQGFYTRVSGYPDLKTGEIKCDILKIEAGGEQRENSFIPVASTTFVNKACVQKFDKSNNNATDPKMSALKKKYDDFQNSLKNQNNSYQGTDYKKNGNSSFLDFADWMDALVTVDPDKIDIPSTITTGEIKVKSGYTIVQSNLILANYKGSLQELYSVLGGNSNSQSLSKANDAIKFSEKNKQLSNSKYVMYLDFFVKSNALIQDIAFSIFLIFLGWNIIGSWAFELFTQRVVGKQENENHVGRAIFGLIVVFMFFTSTSSYSVNNSNQIVSSEETRIQGIIRLIYEWTNETADSFAKIAIQSYLNNLGLSSNLYTSEAIDSMNTEKQTLTKEKPLNAQIISKCESTYDTSKLANMVAAHRQGKTYTNGVDYRKNEQKYTDSSGALGTGLFGNKEYDAYDLNPYPTEKEAKDMFRTSNAYFEAKNGGVVKDGTYNNSSLNMNDTVSLEACNQARTNQVTSMKREAELNKKFDAMNDSDTIAKKEKSIELVSKIMWKAYGEYGYYAVAFLPATTIMVDNIGILGDKNSREDALEEINDESMMQSLSTALPMLALFGGQVPQMYNNLFVSVGDLIGSLFSVGKVASGIAKFFIGGGETPGLISYYLAYLTIDNILKSMVFIVLISGAVLAFIMLALQKLWTFYASLFLVIHAFATKQTDTIPAAIGKVIAVACKTVLLVISIFLAIYSINLLEVFQSLLIGDFYNQMREMVSASTEVGNLMNSLSLNIQLLIFYGIAHVSFLVLKIVLATVIIFKLPGYFYDLLEIRVQDMGDAMLDTVNQAQEQRNMRV